MAKILMVIKSISAGTAIINLHPNGRGRRGQIREMLLDAPDGSVTERKGKTSQK